MCVSKGDIYIYMYIIYRMGGRGARREGWGLSESYPGYPSHFRVIRVISELSESYPGGRRKGRGSEREGEDRGVCVCGGGMDRGPKWERRGRERKRERLGQRESGGRERERNQSVCVYWRYE